MIWGKRTRNIYVFLSSDSPSLEVHRGSKRAVDLLKAAGNPSTTRFHFQKVEDMMEQ